MPAHPTLRAQSLLLRSSGSSARAADVLLYAGTGAPSGAGVHGQVMDAAQTAIYFRQDGIDTTEYLYFTTNGGTTWQELLTLDDLELTATSDITIATGTATLTGAVHTIRGEGGAADNCDTIAGMSNAEIALLVTGAEAITYRDAAVGAGNISTSSDASIVTATGDLVLAVRSGTSVRVIPLVIQAGLALDAMALAAGRIPVGSAGGDAGGVANVGGTAQGVPFGDGVGAVAVGTIVTHASGVSGATAPGTSDSGTASVSMGGATAATTPTFAGASASGTAVLAGASASGAAVLAGSSASGLASVAMGGATASTAPAVEGASASGTAALAGSSASGLASVSMGGSTASTTATSSTITASGCVRYTAPLAAELVSISADAVMANGARVLAGQPDYPRKLQIRITDADASVSAGTVDLIGVGPSGQAVSESVSLTGGTATKPTVNAYATVTSATIAGLVGAGGADNLSIGVGAALGLPGTSSPAAGTFAVYKANLNNANEAIGTVDAAAGTLSPTTAPDGIRNYTIWYTYQYTPTQAGHTHGATGLTAIDAGHTHGVGTYVDSGHTHGAGTYAAAGHTHGATGLTAIDAGHAHGAGTYVDSGHTHGAGTYVDSGHTHGAGTYAVGGHTHGATGLTATDGGHTHAHATTHTHTTPALTHTIA